MKLKRGIQKQIKDSTGFSASYICEVVNGKVRLTSWPTAKRFAQVTNTSPILWLEGSPEEIKKALTGSREAV